MSESSGQEKTEQPTPKRIDDARKKGQVARSRELSGAVVVLAVGSVMALYGQQMVSQLTAAMALAFRQAGEARFESQSEMLGAFGTIGAALFTPVIPLMLAAVIAALMATLAIGGWNLSAKAMAPDFKKIDPLKGFKRMFSLNALVELLKAIGKALLVGGAAMMLIISTRDEWLGLGLMSPQSGILQGLGLAATACVVAAGAYLLVGLLDAPYQLWKHQKDLRMTRQEVRDESKESDGRPEIKSRQRQLQQEMATGRMMEAVPEADVVLVNPIHVAVALRYQAHKDRAPLVVAKGAGDIAERIREIGREHDIPILSSPPLARVLYRTTKVGQEIPAPLFTAIAQVLTWVYQLKREPQVARPAPQPDIPESLKTEARPWQ